MRYPLLYGGQLYKLCDWILSRQTHYTFLSNHQFWSYGQNLTAANVTGLSWSFKGQSNVVAVDANTMQRMFQGLGIVLDNGSGSGPLHYVVTGVYPSQGVIKVLQATNNGSPYLLDGVKTTVYSCPGNCPSTIIGQDSYSFEYP